MVLDIFLVIVALGAFIFIVRVLKDVFPRLVNINVHTIPEGHQERIKRQILEEKLKRDFKKRWGVFRDAVLVERTRAICNFFSGLYQRVQDMEKEYRRGNSKDLSTQVTKIRSIEECVAAARQHMQANEHAKAEQLLLECLKEDEHNTKVYTVLAQVYREQGDFDHARETLEYIMHLTNRSDPGVFSSLAGIARERGDLHTAEEDYLKSISLDPSNHHYYLELAEVYASLDQFREAQASAQKALSLAPNNPKILDFLIENSILLQDKSRAQEYLTKLVEVNPQNGKIPSFRERVSALESSSTVV